MATEYVLTGPIEQSRGVIGRYPAPDEQYVFEFSSVKPRSIHMIGVRRPLQVEWYIDAELIASKRLRQWIGHGRHRANKVIERRPA